MRRCLTQSLIGLIIGQATRALAALEPPPGAPHPGDERLDPGAIAADAMRALCSFASASHCHASAALLAALDGMLAAVQAPARRRPGRDGSPSKQLLVALVHAMHAAHDDGAVALGITQRRCISPLAQAAQALAGALGARPPAAAGGSGELDGLVASALDSLQQAQAMLNTFESYAGDGGRAGRGGGATAALRVESAVVDACLAAWAVLGGLEPTRCPARLHPASLCESVPPFFLPPTNHLQPAQLSAAAGFPAAGQACLIAPRVGEALLPELSRCLCSCISLGSPRLEPALPEFLRALCGAFFLPGAHALHRPLVKALEEFSSDAGARQAVLAAAAAVLSDPRAAPLRRFRGAAADPDTAHALFTLAGAVLRCVALWPAGPPPEAAAAAVGAAAAAVNVAAANVCCHDRVLSRQAYSVLVSFTDLVLAARGSLQSELLPMACAKGGRLVEGLLYCLVLATGARVGPLLADVILLAMACHAAGGGPAADLLQRWSQEGWEAVAAWSAQHEAQAPVAELAAQWDWRPALKAAQRAAAAGGGGAGGDELRRGALRAAKRMVNEVRAAASGVQNALARHALQLQRFD